MTFFQRYDGWAIHRVHAALEFLLEWASIPQSWVERGLIAAYVVCNVVMFDMQASASNRAMDLVLGCITTGCMYILHRTPSALRAAVEMTTPMITLRVALSGFLLGAFLGCLAKLPRTPLDAAVSTVSLACLLSLLYVLAVDAGGAPGRKRKLALEELKKLLRGWRVPDLAGDRA